MATASFEDISTHNWLPTTAYQSVQSSIQQEVHQGLWANHAHPDGWCCIQISPPHGVNNSWATHTYQLKSDGTQTSSVVWPAGWPSPAENVHGQLPGHFFSGGTAAQTAMSQSLHETHPAPASQPTYKPAGACI